LIPAPLDSVFAILLTVVNMEREYFSLPEAAVMLGISRIAVFKKVKQGRLAAIKFGRNWAVRLGDIEKAKNAPRLRPGRPPAKRGAPPVPRSKPRISPEAEDSGGMDAMGWD
jgi:excisionase family DNA binding protein